MEGTLLSQATGYGIIVGLSMLFCLIILAAVRLQKNYLSEDSDQSEMVRICKVLGVNERAAANSTSVHGGESIRGNRSDMLRRIL